MEIKTIETERLLLRELTPEVYRFIFDSYSDADLKKFFGFSSDDELVQEKQRHAGGLSSFNKSFILFHLIEKSSNQVIGWCGYHTWYLNHFRAEIGYVLNDAHHMGKGFMKEAIYPIIDFGFNEMNLNRIEAFIGAENTASLRIIKGLGFTEEGRLREHYNKDDRLEDSLIFSLLKSEYLNRTGMR